MDALNQLKSANNLHHAYLVRGSATSTLASVCDVLAERGVAVQGNPDCFVRSYETISVDEARAIAEYAVLSPLGEHKYVVIAAKSATPEAQTALLKTVEEAVGKSIFFFVFEAGAPVLPTLASRCVSIKVRGEVVQREAEEFLALSYKERLALSEKLAKNHDREGARALVRGLLHLADKKKFKKEILKDLLDADRFLALSGSSVKTVIGHVALVI